MTSLDREPVLRVRRLEVAFPTSRGLAAAVRGVSFDVSPGETLAIVGESGCGKSATALSITRLLPQTARILSGRVECGGVELTTARESVLRKVRGRVIGMVFQDSLTSLNPVLSVRRQITEGIEAHGDLSRSGTQARALSLLEEVGVPDPPRRLRQYPHQLSGGLRQRVAVAVALAANPSILIADEPTTALDVTTQAQLLELLEREQARRGMAMILITHDLGVVARLGDRLGVMYAGRIVESGPVQEVFDHPVHPYTQGLLNSVPRLDGALLDDLPSIPGSPPGISEIGRGCPFAPRCPLRIDRCLHEDPPHRTVSEDHTAACWVRALGPTQDAL